jgi:hypothetical protein
MYGYSNLNKMGSHNETTGYVTRFWTYNNDQPANCWD